MKNCKMDEFEERSSVVYPGLMKRTLGDLKEEGWMEWTGVVDQKLGKVWFSQYMQVEPHKPIQNLMMQIIHEGREYTRSWDAWYGQQTISRLANEFINDKKGSL